MLTYDQKRTIHLKAISRKVFMTITCSRCSDITLLKSLSHIPGATDLMLRWEFPAWWLQRFPFVFVLFLFRCGYNYMFCWVFVHTVLPKLLKFASHINSYLICPPHRLHVHWARHQQYLTPVLVGLHPTLKKSCQILSCPFPRRLQVHWTGQQRWLSKRLFLPLRLHSGNRWPVHRADLWELCL